MHQKIIVYNYLNQLSSYSSQFGSSVCVCVCVCVWRWSINQWTQGNRFYTIDCESFCQSFEIFEKPIDCFEVIWGNWCVVM